MLSQVARVRGALTVVLGIGIWAAAGPIVEAGTPIKTAVLTKTQDGGTVTRTADYRPAKNQVTITPVQWGWRGGYVRPYYRYSYYRAPYSYGYYTGPYYYGYYPSPYFANYPTPYYTYYYPQPYVYYGPQYYSYYGGYYGW
jgi:hypothetical protein